MPSRPSPRGNSSRGGASGGPRRSGGARSGAPRDGGRRTSGQGSGRAGAGKTSGRPTRSATDRLARKDAPPRREASGERSNSRSSSSRSNAYEGRSPSAPRARRRDESAGDQPRRRDGDVRRGSSARPTQRRSRDESNREDRYVGERRGRDARPSRSRDDRPAASGQWRRDDASRRPSRSTSRREPRELTPEQRAREKAERIARKQAWGSVARKGAVHLSSEGQEMAGNRGPGAAPAPLDEWVPDARPTPAKKTTRTATVSKRDYALPGDVVAAVRNAYVGPAYLREKLVTTFTRAAEAYDRHRFEESLRLGREVADQVPGVAAVRELTGLAAYRAERWAMSRIHLRAYFELTGDPEHLPKVMDCDRALRKYRGVEKAYGELSAAEASADVLAEGRIVMAGTWADQRKFAEAIDLLIRAGAAKKLRNPNYRHVRLWYALADVYDRAGDHASARELFSRIAASDPDAYDVQARLAELGSVGPRKQRKRRATPVSKKKLA